jgi:hypothetical protein
MYKSKSRSMQRGTHFRETDESHKVGTYEGTSPVFSTADVPHFDYGNITKAALIEKLRGVIGSLAKNGFKKPADVAPLLNKFNYTTACGAQWTPRLVWFLLKETFGKDQRPKNTGTTQQVKSKKPPLWGGYDREYASTAKATKAEQTSAVVAVESKITPELIAAVVKQLGSNDIVYVFGSSRDVRALSDNLPRSRVVGVKNPANKEMILVNSNLIVRI